MGATLKQDNWKKSSQNNTCILHISNIGPRDEGNYLSNFDNESPNFKAILETNGNNSSETSIVILLLCGLIFFFVIVLSLKH